MNSKTIYGRSLEQILEHGRNGPFTRDTIIQNWPDKARFNMPTHIELSRILWKLQCKGIIKFYDRIQTQGGLRYRYVLAGGSE